MGVVDVYVYAYLQCGVQVKEKLHNKKRQINTRHEIQFYPKRLLQIISCIS